MTGTELQAQPPKKPSLSPKAIIHQKFGPNASYKVEEVQDSTQNGCPGLAISQKGPILYRCTLCLPDTTIVSDTFKRKKDAEQSAAEKAIEKLGICQKEYNPTVKEAWSDLEGRIAFLFADGFLSSLHPLSGHLKATLKRQSTFTGCIPVSAIAIYDSKITNICKYINKEAEVNLQLVMFLVLRAATKITDIVVIPDEQLSLRRSSPYPPEIISLVDQETNLSESIPTEAILIPASSDKAVESRMLNISGTGYYLDVVAGELGLKEASDLMISRIIGKASSEMRIYSSAPKKHLLDCLSELKMEQTIHSEGSFNVRASYLTGQEVYGDAILASVGYTWKSADLFHESVSLRIYYRLLVNMTPSGVHKISRESILAAELPLAFTTKGNWKGSLPRDALCTFCRFNHLSEPIFCIQSKLLNSSTELPASSKKLKIMSSSGGENSSTSLSTDKGDPVESTEAFDCVIKIYSKNKQLILICSPEESHRKQTDAVQSAASIVLSWLNIFFEKPEIDSLNAAKKFDILFTSSLSKEFSLFRTMHNIWSTSTQLSKNTTEEDELSLIDIGGTNSGVRASNGSLACISYTVSLIREDDCMKEHLESCEEFEFEVGNEAVLPHLESAVAQLTVGQSAHFRVGLPPIELILAAANDSATILSLLSSRSCKLEYCATLLQVTEPMEEQMEQAHFSPPLSKQRVEFAVQHIRESSASTLVDLGCGSGSLLDSLLSYPTSLENIIGVDISLRSLAKAAKLLHSKLNKLLESKDPNNKLKSAVLYDGSITKFDSRLRGVDIATCLEVIEHMEEVDACLFGDVVLSYFCPRILIVSTPNYEYNDILQKSSTSHGQEDNMDQPQTRKFRNHDHKFEWTRTEFNNWASTLAEKHNYEVEFSGVGGADDVEPGFASQIAIFKRRGEDNNQDSTDHYETIWAWRRENV